MIQKNHAKQNNIMQETHNITMLPMEAGEWEIEKKMK